jgi:hypothetical protein
MLHPESHAQRSGTPADGSVTHTESASDGANGLRRREQAQKREILLPTGFRTRSESGTWDPGVRRCIETFHFRAMSYHALM